MPKITPPLHYDEINDPSHPAHAVTPAVALLENALELLRPHIYRTEATMREELELKRVYSPEYPNGLWQVWYGNTILYEQWSIDRGIAKVVCEAFIEGWNAARDRTKRATEGHAATGVDADLHPTVQPGQASESEASGPSSATLATIECRTADLPGWKPTIVDERPDKDLAEADETDGGIADSVEHKESQPERCQETVGAITDVPDSPSTSGGSASPLPDGPNAANPGDPTATDDADREQASWADLAADASATWAKENPYGEASGSSDLRAQLKEMQGDDGVYEGTNRLCLRLYGEVSSAYYLGGADARMLHDAADEIDDLRAKCAAQLEALERREDIISERDRQIAQIREVVETERDAAIQKRATDTDPTRLAAYGGISCATFRIISEIDRITGADNDND